MLDFAAIDDSEQSSMGALWIAQGPMFLQWKIKTLVRLCKFTACADPESFVIGGPALRTFFKLMRGGWIQKPL